MTLVVLNGERSAPDGATVEVAVTATGAPADGRGVAAHSTARSCRAASGRPPAQKASRSRCCTPSRGSVMFEIGGP